MCQNMQLSYKDHYNTFRIACVVSLLLFFYPENTKKLKTVAAKQVFDTRVGWIHLLYSRLSQ